MNVEQVSPRPWLPETPLEILGALVREPVLIEGRTFLIDRPEEQDMLDHAVIKASFDRDEYLPYWTELWPAARMLAKVVWKESWPPGTAVLEVGCGLGLPGIVALARGLKVTFSDCDATALQFAANNARINGFDDFETLQFDWRFPPENLKVPMILASDLVYELRNINPLVALIQRLLLPGGVCLLTDADRLPAYDMREALDGEGLKYTTQIMKAGTPGGRRTKGTLFRITRPG